MIEFLERLLRITEGCRPNMHEPDEQNLEAVVTGFHFDNAHGDDPYINQSELTVGLVVKNAAGDVVQAEWFNLASLIALARAADPKKVARL